MIGGFTNHLVLWNCSSSCITETSQIFECLFRCARMRRKMKQSTQYWEKFRGAGLELTRAMTVNSLPSNLTYPSSLTRKFAQSFSLFPQLPSHSVDMFICSWPRYSFSNTQLCFEPLPWLTGRLNSFQGVPLKGQRVSHQCGNNRSTQQKERSQHAPRSNQSS